MSHTTTRYFGLALTFFVVAAAVAILNVTPAVTAQASCQADSGGGGGEEPSSTPTGSSTPSATKTGGGGLPITIPPIGGDDETATPSGSPSTPPGENNDPQRCSTTVTIASERARASSTTVNFHGSLKSKNSTCEGGRKVALKRKRPGRDRTVGNTVSKDSGRWSVKEPNARGRYYAVAAKRTVGSVNCLAGRSKTIDA